MTDEQFAKLPKWAQAEFQQMRLQLNDAQEIKRKLLGEFDPKLPSYGDYDDLRGRSLPCRQVWFRNQGITVRLDEGGGVRVSGDGRLTIEPHVTNVITIRSDRVDGDG